MHLRRVTPEADRTAASFLHHARHEMIPGSGYGLAGRDCGVDSDPGREIRGFIWESPDLVVFLSRITPEGGVPRLTTMATDIPSAVPTAVVCPVPQPS